jgi:hypothetical protein
MKKIHLIRLWVIFFCVPAISQTVPKFKVTKEGVKPVIIALDTSYSANLIYTRVKQWISLNNKNPYAVTKIDNVNSLIKFSCYKEKAWRIKNNGIDYWNDLQYTLAIEIKDAKCRVTFATDDNRYKVWFNKDGALIKNFKESETTFEAAINETLASLYEYIKGQKKPKDDW